jgi:hypothetical protein
MGNSTEDFALKAFDVKFLDRFLDFFDADLVGFYCELGKRTVVLLLVVGFRVRVDIGELILGIALIAAVPLEMCMSGVVRRRRRGCG